MFAWDNYGQFLYDILQILINAELTDFIKEYNDTKDERPRCMPAVVASYNATRRT